jgi:hypothetical protein
VVIDESDPSEEGEEGEEEDPGGGAEWVATRGMVWGGLWGVHGSIVTAGVGWDEWQGCNCEVSGPSALQFLARPLTGERRIGELLG